MAERSESTTWQLALETKSDYKPMISTWHFGKANYSEEKTQQHWGFSVWVGISSKDSTR